jgi:tetracycline 7-halogenase / FADH2 O2-dependent halogenase
VWRVSADVSQRQFQIAVIGSGFAGSLMAMIAQRLGFSTVLLERGRHPRFVIGESSTPLANLLLEELADQYDLPPIKPLCKWGPWQKHAPHIACGLKRGFTFYQHELGRPFARDPDRRRQLLVGASPCEAIADTHWYRPDFDQFLVEQAQALGVEYWDELELRLAGGPGLPGRLIGKRHGQSLEIRAELLIDASGPRGFLQRALGLAEATFADFPATQALFSHFAGVGPLPECFCASDQAPPFPPEQAAVHHVFPGGWVWVLKFNNGLTSAGVAACDPLAKTLELRDGEPAWQRLLDKLPSLGKMFAGARATLPFVHQPRIACQAAQVSGPYWALLPSAAGVVDPLLSTGFPLTLLGIKRLGAILKEHWGKSSLLAELEEYGRATQLELQTAAALVGALYATMDRFELFKDLSLLYFAAASYSETARRLGKPHLANSFLLCRHPEFSAQLRQFCTQARAANAPQVIAGLHRAIRRAIRPYDVAGLTDEARDPWYPCLTADLYRHGHKLGASPEEVRAMLIRCGLEDGAEGKLGRMMEAK